MSLNAIMFGITSIFCLKKLHFELFFFLVWVAFNFFSRFFSFFIDYKKKFIRGTRAGGNVQARCSSMSTSM